jgi:predicted dithiol-disulfide oxidoreductase (DUF899 family)
VVSKDEWLKARLAHLAAEKEFTRKRDELSRQRRELPWERVEKNYVFEGPTGRRTLADLFEGRRQLIIYHFMFDPAWEEGCKSCSFVADHFAGALTHLAARDTSLAVISRAPLAKIERFKKRMGWNFQWFSSSGGDFNYDFQATIDKAHPEYNYRPHHSSVVRVKPKGGPPEGEAPGLSVFLREGDQIYHTYSTYARGLDLFMNTYNFLDHTPLGRQEDGRPMGWVRHHDKYAAALDAAATHERSSEMGGCCKPEEVAS